MPLLLIDLDDSLLDRGACFRSWASAFASSHGRPEDVEWLISIDGNGYVPRHELFRQVSERFGLATPTDELVRNYHATYPDHMQPPSPEAVARLERLRADGWRIGVVTNGSPHQQRKLTVAGVEHLVDACCISEVEGVRKPDPEIFRRAAARCGCSLEGAWMIGDNAEADIGGAHALGLRTIWLHMGRAWTETAYAPTATAGSLSEGLELLR